MLKNQYLKNLIQIKARNFFKYIISLYPLMGYDIIILILYEKYNVKKCYIHYLNKILVKYIK